MGTGTLCREAGKSVPVPMCAAQVPNSYIQTIRIQKETSVTCAVLAASPFRYILDAGTGETQYPVTDGQRSLPVCDDYNGLVGECA